MSANKNAVLRYRTIDKCLQNRRRKWTIEDLIDACSDALSEFGRGSETISLRTIRADISLMRSDSPGYNAPIVVTDKRYYTYEDPEFSITTKPLSAQDLDTLKAAAEMLQQFRGFSHFSEMSSLLSKLEDRIFSEEFQSAPVIDFERNDLLRGIERLESLHKFILNERVLCVKYKSFRAKEAGEIIFHPYLLKEYRNRWFLLGMKPGGGIMTLALDRIEDVEERPRISFERHPEFNATTYFREIVGVTRNLNGRSRLITFKVNPQHAPYILTKPIHYTQKVQSEDEGGTTFTIKVIINYELERELLGFGEGLRVISPRAIVRSLREKARLMHHMYQNAEDET